MDLLGPGLVARRVQIQRELVVYLKGLLEASEGLAVVFAERGSGDLLVACPESRAADLDELLRDVADETGAVVAPWSSPAE